MALKNNISPQWIEAQYLLWRKSPDKLPPDWQAFFSGYEMGRETPAETAPAVCLTPEMAAKQSSVDALIYRYREMGHLLACTDPLSPCPTEHPLLALDLFGLERKDLDTTFHLRSFPVPAAPLRNIIALLRQIYCGSIGIEYMHIQDPAEKEWLRERMETTEQGICLDREDKLTILRKLQEATLFESFLHRHFLGQKRFSLEGSEVMIPVLDRILHRAAGLGIRDVVLGMPHRGRLNTLANIFSKPLEAIFAEFEDNLELEFVGEGDVKYHLGFSTDLDLEEGPLHLTMTSNPSHLEAVDPVVEGKVRARQDAFSEEGDKKVLPLLLHGDAAFAGQGIVAEVLNLSQLEGYRTGGTLHIVINNQIGFTTVPEDARSTHYATDVAKMLMVPIFHIHGENPEAAIRAVEMALDYRQRFGRDVVMEIICYRRQGHNEGDEPYFTQPLMYEKIRQRPSMSEIYARQLMEEGVGEDLVEKQAAAIRKRLDQALGGERRRPQAGFEGKWGRIERDFAPWDESTAVAEENLLELADGLARVPKGFNIHPRVEKLLRNRLEAVREDSGIDWATAESLAFASLVTEGHTVRLSGQDSRRGTFSQRHAVLFDTETGSEYTPLTNFPQQAPFSAFDSPLSEASVLGFEYGYSLETPDALVLWEAQFGDFANGAQVIIDQFVTSSLRKWSRASGLVLLLPHGYEGQGPEHSSARIERFLQSCAENNLLVVNPSTPAQFFHLLRRQVKLPFRRPLVVFTPKSLLRNPLCRSRRKDLTDGRFREILPADQAPEQVTDILLCSGKIYFDLLDKKEQEGCNHAALIRIEQLYPLRADLLKQAVAPFGKKARLAWVQEEPKNMGPWRFLAPRLAEILGTCPTYIGRDEAAAPAGGSHRWFKQEQEEILRRALNLNSSGN
ncbi:MAG: 2-oxoglutarate dehydrogenase E1 component [Syntrophotaleaceae bacterium]